MSFKVVSSARKSTARSNGRVAPTMLADTDTMDSISDIRRGKLTWEILYKSSSTFDPDSSKVQLWHTFLLALVLYDAWLVPLLVSFSQLNPAICRKTWLQMLATAGEVFFVVDVYVHMHSRFYLFGDPIRDVKFIRRYYLMSWGFPLDLLALVPINTIIPALASTQPCGLGLLNKLLRLRKVPAYTLTFDKVFARYYKLCKVVKAVVVVYFSCHVMACVYASFGKLVDPSKDEDAWKMHDFSTSTHERRRRRLSSDSSDDQHTSQLLTEYLAALFWSLGLVSKCVEGQVPRTLMQTLFMLAVMISGFLLFVYICGTLFMISKCDANSTQEFDAKRNQLRYILSYHQVPMDIQSRAVEYFENGFKSGEVNDRHTMQLLCPSIAKDIKYAALKDMVTGVPFFKYCRAAFIRALIDLMETQSVPTNYIVCRKDEEGEDMYFVQSGVLVILVDDIKLRELRSGHYFGEQAIFMNQIRSADVVATTFCILQRLSRARVRMVMQGYPECESQILSCVSSIADEQRKNSSKLIQQRSLTKSTGAAVFHIDEHSSPTEGSTKQQATQRRMSKRFVGPLGEFADGQSEQVGGKSPTIKFVLHRCLLKTAISRKSTLRLVWLLCVMATTGYNVVVVPFVNAFELVGYPVSVFVLNTIADAILWLDIYGKFNLTYVHEAEHVEDTVKCAQHYYQTTFLLDLASTIPLWVVRPSLHVQLRVFRLLRVLRLNDELDEVSLFVRIDSRKRIVLLGMGLLMCYHIAGCMAHALTLSLGYGTSQHGWLPPKTIELQKIISNNTGDLLGYTYMDGAQFVPLEDPLVNEFILRQYTRALQYGTVCLTDLGRVLEPETLEEFALALGLMLCGLLLISLLIDDVQKCVTASAVEQMQFLTLRSQMMHFFRKEKLPQQVRSRVSAYLDFWWSAHRGANINELLGELPNTIRRDIYGFVCAPVLDVIELMDGMGPHFERVCDMFLDNIVVNLYAQGELVYNQGEYADSLLVLLAGDVMLSPTLTGLPQRYVKPGEIFGCSSLVLDGACNVHTDNAVARAASVVARVSQDTLAAITDEYPTFCHGLLKKEYKLLAEHRAMARLLDQSELAAMSQNGQHGVVDPNSTFMMLWETLHVAVLAMHVVGVPYFFAFGFAIVGVQGRNFYAVAIEVFFLMDIVLKTRTGYYSFGNKVTDLKKIRSHYHHSVTFVLDVVAILPLDCINVYLPHQSEVWNLNKLVRLLKLPALIEKVEAYFFAINIHIRVVKLVFFVYLLAHYIGCAWYGCASFPLTIWGQGDDCRFGNDTWLPSKDMHLTNNGMSLTFKYTRALYWGLGVLLGFNKGEYPATPFECVFTMVVQTAGVFLLAYVVGNLLDIALVMDGNNQLFYSNLIYVRKLTTYFDFTDDVKTKIQHFYFYRLFHSIHEEHVLTDSLPPNLVGDIRLFLLTPMLKKVPFFQDEMDNSNVARSLVRHLTQVLVTRHEVVCHQYDVGIDMYFVFVGCLNVYVSHTDRDTVSVHNSLTYESSHMGNKVAELYTGSFFGERSLFSDQPRMATIQANTFCTLYKLSRTHMESVFVQYPEWKVKVIQVVEEIYNIRQHKNNQRMGPSVVEPPSSEQAPTTDTSSSPASSTPVECSKVNSFVLRVVSTGRHLAESVVLWLRKTKSMVTAIEVQSPFYRAYLQLVRCTLLYVAMREPYVVTFGAAASPSAGAAVVMGLDIAATIVFVFDMWFKYHIIEKSESFEFYDRIPHPTRVGLALDILVVLPLDSALATFGGGGVPWRLVRMIKLRQLNHVFRELQRFSMSHELNRIKLLALYYCIVCYWTACAYFGMASILGFSSVWESSLPVAYFASPPASARFDMLFLMHRFSRCLYYAVNMYTGVGMVYEPSAPLQYAFNLIMHVVGIFVMGYVIGEGSTLCIYLIQNEVDFKINQMNVMDYLARKNKSVVDTHLHARIHNYLSYWWSFQDGVNYQAILEQLPLRIRGQAMFEISRRSLSRFSVRYIRPLVHQRGIDPIIHKLVRRLTFQGYPAGESVIIQGNIGHTMYFVSSGTVMTVSTLPNFMPSRFEEGQFFGDEGLMASTVRHYSAVTLRACDLLALAADDFLNTMNETLQTKEGCRVARGVATYQKSFKYRLAYDKGSLGQMICNCMMDMASTLRTLSPMTPDVAEIMLGHFTKLFLPPHVHESGGYSLESISMCQHCEATLSHIYCKQCRQVLCKKCSSLMHDNTHLSFHLPSIMHLKTPNEPPPEVPKTPRLREFVLSVLPRRRNNAVSAPPHASSVTGLDTSSSFHSVARPSTSKPLQTQRENDTGPSSPLEKHSGHVKRPPRRDREGGSIQCDSNAGEPHARQLVKLTHTKSEAELDCTEWRRARDPVRGGQHKTTMDTINHQRKRHKPVQTGMKSSQSTPKIIRVVQAAQGTSTNPPVVSDAGTIVQTPTTTVSNCGRLTKLQEGTTASNSNLDAAPSTTN